jgi:hypothetical protein
MAPVTDDTTNTTTTTQEVDTSCNSKTDVVENTSTEAAEEVTTPSHFKTDTDDVEDTEVEEEDENIFVIRLNDKNYGWTYTMTEARAAAQELCDDILSQDTSLITYSVKKDDEIRIYGIYRFYFLAYERLMHIITIDEVPRLTFTD